MSKFQEYLVKYVRDTDKVVAPRETNPFPQMKTDSFILKNDTSFGGLGGGVDWRYIHEPVSMFPELKESVFPRLITILGGSGVNYLKLHGEVEITLGNTREDAQTFKFDESASVYVKKGMFYNINITKINSSDCPIHYNEFTFGYIIPQMAAPAEGAAEGSDYAKYIKSGEELWAKDQPHHEVVYPVVSTGSSQFGATEPIRRTWMPVSEPHMLANKAHYHEFLEYIVFYGSDPDNITDLGGTVEFTIGESEDELEVITITKSTQFYIRPGLWHSPMVFTEIKDKSKPIVFCEVTYANGFGPDSGNTVWIDGVPPARPEPK